MAETLHDSMGDFIARFIQRLSKDPALQGMTPDEIKNEALKRIREAEAKRTAAKNKEVNERRIRKSKEWVDKVKSNDTKIHNEALTEAEKAKYTDAPDLNSANEHLDYTKKVFSTDTPGWLKTNIQECPEAVELIARVTQLPPDLQNDPNVLYLELAKMNKSVKWSGASSGARKEARVVQDKVLARIRAVAGNDPEFGDASRDELLGAVDPLRMHLKEFIPGAPVGSQEHNLQNTLDTYQEIFDLEENQRPDNLQEQLENFIRDLRSGMVGENAQYNKKDTIEYLASAQHRLNLMKEYLGQQREKQYGEVITLGELRQSQWFVGDKLSKTTEKMPDNISFRFGQHWTKQDVDYLREKGVEKWFYRYVDRVFGLGMERKQPSLAQQYIYEDFQNFLITMYGGNEATNMLTRFQTLWEERSRFDYIVHSLGLGPGDMKHRLEAMSMLQSSDLDYLNTFTYAELANTFMERETFALMGEKMAAYEKQLKWLDAEVTNDFYSADTNAVFGKLKKIYPDKSDRDIEGLVELYGKTEISRKGYLKVLNAEKIIQHDSGEFANKGYRRRLEEIQLASDQVARGVILEDIDVWGYSDLEIHLVKVSEEITRLEQGHRGDKNNPIKLSDYEVNHYDDLLDELKKREQRLLQKKLAKIQDMEPGWKNIQDRAKLLDDLANRKGLSQIEVRVYERMREYLEAKTGEEPDEMVLRQAIWAARTQIIGTGRMAAIGAMMARAPGSGEYGTVSAKHIMQAPAFEELVRAMNVEMFASRFSMGGKMGDVVRAYLRFNLRKERIGMRETGTGSTESFFDTDEWKEMKRGIQDKKAKETARVMEFAEKDLGIKFDELLAPGFLGTGGQFDGTAWRLDRGVLDEIKKYYLDLQKNNPNAALDNQALAIRYLIADGSVGRKEILEKMMHRAPTKFFTLLADKRDSMMVEAGLTATDETWYQFENALKYAETDLWRDKKYIFKDIKLETEADFDALVRPYLEDKNMPANDIEKCRTLIEVLQKRLTSTGPERAEYKTYLDGLAQEKLPLTLSLDDFNWLDTDMKSLGTLAFPRRTRDIGGMDAAKDIVLAFITNRDNILSPSDVKDSIKQLLAIKGAVNSYSTTDAAEKVVKQLSRLLIEFNRDRSLWSAPSFLPGGKSVGKLLAGLDLRPNAPYRGPIARAAMTAVGIAGEATLGTLAKLSSTIKPVESALNWMMPGWKGFSKEPFENWPHSIAEAISWSTRFTGGAGNRWNEAQINHVLDQMGDAGLFTENREFLHDLRGEFKAGIGFKLLALGRYWWVIPVATIAVTVMGQVEEEKKKGH